MPARPREGHTAGRMELTATTAARIAIFLAGITAPQYIVLAPAQGAARQVVIAEVVTQTDVFGLTALDEGVTPPRFSARGP